MRSRPVQPLKDIERVPFTAFPWTGVCFACHGKSNKYDLYVGTKRQRKSASTVVLSGQVQLADGFAWNFGPQPGQRIEVCYPCRWRLRRKGSFVRTYTHRPKTMNEPAIRDYALRLYRAGHSLKEISKRVMRDKDTVSRWLNKAIPAGISSNRRKFTAQRPDSYAIDPADLRKP